MRYVLIVMFLFSSLAQAEEWESILGYDGMYYSKSDYHLNLRERTILVKMLIDDIGDASAVLHYQFRCADGKPVKERILYSLRFQGRMGTGERDIIDADGPWIPFRASAYQQTLDIWCEVMEDARKKLRF